MPKGKVIVIIGIVLLVIIFVVLFLPKKAPEPTEPNETLDLLRYRLALEQGAPCSTIQDETLLLNCVIDTLNKETSVEVCDRFTQQSAKDICYVKLAKRQGKLEYCEFISNEEQKAECVLDLARKGKNPELCEKLEGQYRDSCLFSVSAALDTATHCDKIADANLSAICFFRKPEMIRPELCEKLRAQPFIDDCWISLGLAYRNPTFCKEAQDENKHDQCLHRLYGLVPPDCGEFKTLPYRSACRDGPMFFITPEGNI